jgi:DNA-binding HxlR family transcriptional regulator
MTRRKATPPPPQPLTQEQAHALVGRAFDRDAEGNFVVPDAEAFRIWQALGDDPDPEPPPEPPPPKRRAASLWRWQQEMAAAAALERDRQTRAAAESVDATDLIILRVLNANPGYRLGQRRIATETRPRVSQRTIATRLPRLSELGLVDRPSGQHAGYVITPLGRELLRGQPRP